MSFMLRFLFVVLFLVAPLRAWALFPLQVEETNTQGKGSMLFEVNGDHRKDGDFKTDTVTGIFTVGASKNTDFSLEIPYVMLDPSVKTGIYEQGSGDLRLNLKYRIYENEVKQSLGFKIYTDFPTGDVNKGLGAENYHLGFQIMDQQECGNNILHLSVGYDAIGREMAKFRMLQEYAFRFGLAAEHKFTQSFRILLELAGENRRQADGINGGYFYSLPVTALAGFKYDISRSWYVDLAARKGLNKYAEDYTGLAGIAVRF